MENPNPEQEDVPAVEAGSENTLESEDKKIERLKEIILSKLQALKESGDIEKFLGIIPTLVDDLDKKYGQAQLHKYKLYHALRGSTTDDAMSPEFDLPGGVIEGVILSDW